MRPTFPLFQSHLDLPHSYWKEVVKPGDTVIDATCGNGHDTLFLAKIALTDNSGHVFALDIQKTALQNTTTYLKENLPPQHFSRIHFHETCHSTFPETQNTVKLIVYNLGYLPGGDKGLTTRVNSTLSSLKNAMRLLADGGVISITCYPGHAEGRKEEEALLKKLQSLPPFEWQCSHQCWINRKEAPSLLILQKKLGKCSGSALRATLFFARTGPPA